MWLPWNLHVDILNWSVQLRNLLTQIDGDNPVELTDLPGERATLLLALRDLQELGLIDGQLQFSDARDEHGALLESASAIRLTGRGKAFIGQ